MQVVRIKKLCMASHTHYIRPLKCRLDQLDCFASLVLVLFLKAKQSGLSLNLNSQSEA
jgi:hypothetical protein